MSRSFMRRDRITAFLMLLPSIILIAVFVYGFIGRTAYSSMTDWKGVMLKPTTNFIGLANYKQLFTGLINVRFRQSLVNTFYFTILFVVLCLVTGLSLAMLLDRNIRAKGIFRNIFLYPMSLSFIVTGTVWRWLLNPVGGINRLPELFGSEALNIKWITDRTQILQFNWQFFPRTLGIILVVLMLYLVYRSMRKHNTAGTIISGIIGILAAIWLISGGAEAVTLSYPELHGFNLALIGIILAASWQMSGYTMAMYLAGMTSIAEELREAAYIDGANEFQMYRYIVFPMLAPITLSAMIVLGHISLKIFDLIWVMAGQDNATTDVPGTLMFTTSFRGNQFALGAAIAMVMLILVALVIVPYLVNTLRSEQEL